MTRFYITTAIPYVNAAPHLGHALEFVQADVLARHKRLRGHLVRFLTGTDDNALKNVTAAAAAGCEVREFVAANAARFAGLAGPLALSFDDVIRTGTDPRHADGVERFWRRSAARGDFYRRRYSGAYCGGCEQFYAAGELTDGVCPEHATTPEAVTEENWFFRQSRYTAQVIAALESDRVRIEPASRRNEVLAFVRGGLTDISVSRPAARARGWGIGVPDDPSQVVYVWWDALANYVTALAPEPAYRDWWAGSAERVHVIGKGIVRFHAVYWLALLLSAGEPLPTAIFVHDYLTVDGAKLSKSAGNAVDPVALAERYGGDAVRWWLLADVARVGDTDFTVARLVDRYNTDLANGLGNLVNRTITLIRKYRDGQVPPADETCGRALAAACSDLPGRIDAALARFDVRAAAAAACELVAEGNRLVETERPWALARAETAGDAAAGRRLDGVLGLLVRACRLLAVELGPFIPTGAASLHAQLGTSGPVGAPSPAFPRLDRPAVTADQERSPRA